MAKFCFFHGPDYVTIENDGLVLLFSRARLCIDFLLRNKAFFQSLVFEVCQYFSLKQKPACAGRVFKKICAKRFFCYQSTAFQLFCLVKTLSNDQLPFGLLAQLVEQR